MSHPWLPGRLLLSGVLILALVTAVAGCGGKPAGETPAPQQPQVAVYADNEDPVVYWDPADACSNEVVVLNEIYETLLKYDPIGDKFEPVLATDYSRSQDGLEWTFHLRQGVKFHTGNEMTSEAVKFSVERAVQRGAGVSYIWGPVDQILTPDAYTVVFKLKYPAALDLIVASSYGAHIVDPKEVQAHPDDWLSQGHEAGTGPYMLESWEKGGDYVLTKFPDYWRGWEGKHFDKVVFKGVTDGSTARQMLEAGQIDFIPSLPPEQIEGLKNNPNTTIVSAPSWKTMVGPMNTKKKPLSNKLVRQAISYAVPYQEIVNTALQGYAIQSRGIIPMTLWGHADDLFQYTTDLDKAKELLKKAGYPNGGLKLLLTYPSGADEVRRMAELMKASFAQVGVDLEIRAMNWEQQWDLAKNPDPNKRQDILLYNWWPAYADPYDNFVNMFHTEKDILFNLSYYSNPQVDELMDKARETAGIDRAKAVEMYKQAQEIIMEEAPQLCLYDAKSARAMASSLKGYKDNPAYQGVVFFYNCYREPK
ncbi:MAG TPA: ABC transporter substrate-binding protein [Firmicutes bacterium]|nr:ABC transporter substrate-binding protein [Bacillota bacterium]